MPHGPAGQDPVEASVQPKKVQGGPGGRDDMKTVCSSANAHAHTEVVGSGLEVPSNSGISTWRAERGEGPKTPSHLHPIFLKTRPLWPPLTPILGRRFAGRDHVGWTPRGA